MTGKHLCAVFTLMDVRELDELDKLAEPISDSPQAGGAAPGRVQATLPGSLNGESAGSGDCRRQKRDPVRRR